MREPARLRFAGMTALVSAFQTLQRAGCACAIVADEDGGPCGLALELPNCSADEALAMLRSATPRSPSAAAAPVAAK